MSPPGYRCFKGALQLLAVMYILFFAPACKKKNYSYNVSANLYVANNVVFVERGLFRTFNVLLKANLDPSLRRDGVAVIDKAVVHFDTSANIITIKYQNTFCADSVVRNGQVFIKMNGNFFMAGTRLQIYFDKYTEDGRQFVGADSLVNIGAVEGGKCSFQSKIDSLVIRQDSGASSSWHSEFQYKIPSYSKMTSDSLAPVLITGTAGGWTDEGYKFMLTISSPLVDNIYCQWIREGVHQLWMPALEVVTGSVEYVNSATCNNRVTYRFGDSMMEWWINKKKLFF